ncbi:hypothetical protein LCGC14_1361140, partial [marine sediment metagenome]
PQPYNMVITAWAHREARFQFLETWNRLVNEHERVPPYPCEWGLDVTDG